MSDVFEVLKRDHEMFRRMMMELEDGPTATAGADAAQLAARKALIQRLIIEECKHEAIEQRHLWPVVRQRVVGGELLAREAVRQEQDGEHILDRLDRYDPATTGYEELLARYVQDAREHMAYEEARVWPALREAINEREAVALGERLERARRTAPTRPHPYAPSTSTVQRVIRPALALVDRLRDAVSGRGRERPSPVPHPARPKARPVDPPQPAGEERREPQQRHRPVAAAGTERRELPQKIGGADPQHPRADDREP